MHFSLFLAWSIIFFFIIEKEIFTSLFGELNYPDLFINYADTNIYFH